MNDSVMLPFCVPWFATTQIYAAPGLAMAGHPTAYNGYLNQCITLICSRRFLRGYSGPQLWIPKANIGNFDFLEKFAITSKYGHPYFKTIIRQMLDDGYYVYFNGVDDFYMPGKSWYGIRHMNHDGIICGYDESDETYSIAAYDINWVYNLIRIPQACFFEGLESSMQRGVFGTITAYKMKNVDVPLNERKILDGLKAYLSSTVDKFSLDEDGEVDGIAVHDFFAMYLDRLKDGSIRSEKMDWRAMRPIWEQKRCMLDRIRAIEEKQGWDTELSRAYQPLVEIADRARMMYAMYHKNQKSALLDKIKRGILEIKDKEHEILQALIKRMEEEKV